MYTQLMRKYETETGAPFADSPTGLFNHGIFQIALDREVKRSDRHGGPLTLALVGLDSFADYNKRHGSVAGDRVLKEIAGIIMKNIRQIDLAARYSGDVLAIILAKSEIQQALVVLERVRKEVEAFFWWQENWIAEQHWFPGVLDLEGAEGCAGGGVWVGYFAHGDHPDCSVRLRPVLLRHGQILAPARVQRGVLP